jgi:beta-glucuronidase
LDGAWDFKLDPDHQGVEARWFERFPADHERLFVPSCWNNELNKFEYEGPTWYRTTVTCTKREHLRIVFHAVLGHADVYWDGRHLGYHYGGYTPFEFVLPNQAEGTHELIIRTDSTLDKTTIPYEIVDWFHYGGIIRPVELQRLSDVFIQGLRVNYKMISEDEAEVVSPLT